MTYLHVSRAAMFAIVAMSLSLLSGAVIGLWLSQMRLVALTGIRMSVVHIDHYDSLAISVDEHPPWAQSHLIDVSVCSDTSTIEVKEFYVAWNPFGRRVFVRSPIVLKERLTPGTYTLRFWNGTKMEEAGQAVISEQRAVTITPPR